MSKKIYLASKSPRRQELLSLMGFSFELLLKDVDESYPDTLPTAEIAQFIAQKKADAFDLRTDGVIITSDTIVVLNHQVLGKPKDREDAIAMLQLLNGKMHEVITGVCIKSETETIAFSEVTKVYFKELSLNDIEFYVDKYQPYDKAGSYGIQEWIGLVAIQKIEGSYSNVMGLPTEKLYDLLVRVVGNDIYRR